MLNKIGISNPSPGAYYYLDLMGRNKKLLFDISIGTTPDELLDTVIQQAETLNSPDGDCNPTADSDHEADDPIYGLECFHHLALDRQAIVDDQCTGTPQPSATGL